MSFVDRSKSPRNRRDVPTRLLSPPKRKNCQQAEFSSFWTFSRQMAWVCAEPSRSRTSDNLDERFHVQRDVRHARTSHRTSRNDTGKSAWHSSNANPARRAVQILPAMPGSILAHSNAENGRIRGSPSAHRTLRRQRQHPRLPPGEYTSQPTGVDGMPLVATSRTRPTRDLRVQRRRCYVNYQTSRRTDAVVCANTAARSQPIALIRCASLCP